MKYIRAFVLGLLATTCLSSTLSGQETPQTPREPKQGEQETEVPLLNHWQTTPETPQVKRGRVSLQLGTISGVNYEYALGERLSLRGSAGLMLAGAGAYISRSGFNFAYDGFIPYTSLAPYWYYGGGRGGGGFVTLALEAYWTNMRILVDRSRFDRNHLYTFSITPAWGYTRPISDELAVRVFTGLSLGWHAMRTDDGTRLVRDKSSFPITYGVGIDYRL